MENLKDCVGDCVLVLMIMLKGVLQFIDQEINLCSGSELESFITCTTEEGGKKDDNGSAVGSEGIVEEVRAECIMINSIKWFIST